MAAKKNESVKKGPTREHPSGVDRWTSNGLGIEGRPLTPEHKARVEALNRELDAQRKQSRGGKTPAKKK